ncbi:unnamed protein product [Durusdinium trenchii]|uniref:PIPK domain-containing protein n=1 Tax=Durusdinium trenchii TaxID=1381693 RepID=A0ABP0N1K3_9DINO
MESQDSQDEDLRALEELPWSAAGRSRGRQEDAGKGKKGPKGHGKKGQAKGKGKTGKAGAWAKDLEDEHVRSIVQDLPAEAAGRRRRQQSDLLMSEAAAGRAFLQALEESLLKHAEMERRRGELVDRAQRRHERLSLLAEEARVMLMELRQPVLLATPRISSPQRRVSASQGQGQGAGGLLELAGFPVLGPMDPPDWPSPARSSSPVRRSAMIDEGSSESRSLSPPPAASALSFWSTCFREGLRRVCQRQASPDVSGGLPEHAFEEMFSTQLTSQRLVHGRHRAVSFVAYYPEVFRDLRQQAWGVSEDAFMQSMCDGPLSGGQQGEGKSGMLFFVSWDKKYLAKTVMQKEVTFFADHLANYHSHMRGFSASFLPRFMGLYCLQFPKERVPHYLVVFENLFPPGLKFEAKYDLKGVLGSHRYVSAAQRASGVEVLKDRNFLERAPLRPSEKKLVVQLEKDVDFLEKHGRIDYSLLLGVARASQVKGQALESGIQTLAADGTPGEEVLYMGIIDILQEYSNTKAMESTLKSLKYSLKKNFRKQSTLSDLSTAVSSMPPPDYAPWRGAAPPTTPPTTPVLDPLRRSASSTSCTKSLVINVDPPLKRSPNRQNRGLALPSIPRGVTFDGSRVDILDLCPFSFLLHSPFLSWAVRVRGSRQKFSMCVFPASSVE